MTVENGHKKAYAQSLDSFDPYITRLFQYVWDHGKFSIEFMSKNELMGERLRLYRFRASMRAFKPDDPLTKFMADVEVRYNPKTLVLEIIHRPGSTRTAKWALEKAEKGEYNAPVANEVADATTAIFESMKRDQLKYGEDDEGK